MKTLSTEILAQDMTICEEWSLSIDLKLPNRSMTNLTNIFNAQVNGTTDLTGGSYIPTVSIRSDQSNVTFMITNNDDTEQKYTHIITKKLDVDNWINLKINQLNGVQEIKIDYELVYNKINHVPKTWTNVNLVTENNMENKNNSTFVLYRNFDIYTRKTKGKI